MKEKFNIHNIPAMLYGEASDRVFLFVHGKCGDKEEAKVFYMQVRIILQKEIQLMHLFKSLIAHLRLWKMENTGFIHRSNWKC